MSKEDKPIHYESHPVSAERKAKLIAKGVRIVDAAFAPADWQPEAETSEAEAPKAKPKAEAKPKPEAEAPKE